VSPPPHQTATRHIFLVACLFECGLLLLACLLLFLFNFPIRDQLEWHTPSLLLGCLATLPMLALLLWLLRSTLPFARRLQQLVAVVILPLFQSFSVVQILVVSVLAGFGEELLFRAAIQAPLAKVLGPVASLAATAILFGLAHAISPGYTILAAAMGLYLGWLWLFAGNLLPPITAHALYDFAALLYLVRGPGRRAAPTGKMPDPGQ